MNANQWHALESELALELVAAIRDTRFVAYYRDVNVTIHVRGTCVLPEIEIVRVVNRGVPLPPRHGRP